MKDPDDVLTEIATDEIWFNAGTGPRLWPLIEFRMLVGALLGNPWSVGSMDGHTDWQQVRRIRDTLKLRGTQERVTVFWLARFDGFDHLERRLVRGREWA